MPTLARRAVDEFVARNACEDLVLDLGCGGAPYAKHFPNRVGCDVEARVGVHVRADALRLPFRNETFEAILCTEMLEHVVRPDVAIGEMFRVLRPGGRLILTTRFLYPMHGAPHDYFRFTRFGLLRLFAGWELERLDEDLTSIETAAQLAEYIANQWPRWLRWPAKALIQAGRRLAALLVRRGGASDEWGGVASGYLIVAMKPLGEDLPA